MTDAELTILSLLAEGPRYGHEVQQTIDERGLREWVTIGFSSVYYLLNKLESQRMLRSEMRAEGRGPGRKLFAITDAGRGVLQTAIADLLRQPRTLGTGFELGLANLSSLKPAQTYVALRHHQTDLRRQLELIKESWARHQESDEEIPPHITALYTHSIALMQAELEWMTQFVADWAERYPAVKDVKGTHETEGVTSQEQTTRRHQRPLPDRDKLLQRLKRPKPPEES